MVIDTLHNPGALERMKKELAGVTALLGDKGASNRAARIIFDLIMGSQEKISPPAEAK